MSDLARTSITLPAALLRRVRTVGADHNAALSRVMHFVIDRGITELERNPRLAEQFRPDLRSNGAAAREAKRAKK